MNTHIRKFNEMGLLKFEELLDRFIREKSIDRKDLEDLLSDFSVSEEIENSSTIKIGNESEKFGIAKLISESLNLENNTHFYYDKGLWTWLAALFLEKLVPLNRIGTERNFREKALYILETNSWNRYYRHLLAFPTWIYSELKEKGKIFLRGEIHERGEIVEQLASVNEIQRNKNIVEAATLLFYNPKSDDIYRGAASKNQGGTARRFRAVIQQFNMTFDLNAMNGHQIVSILPLEFRKWKNAS